MKILYFYNFDIDIKEKLINYIANNTDFLPFLIEFNNYEKYFSIYSQINFYISNNKNDATYFRYSQDELNDIKNIKNTKELLKIHRNFYKNITYEVVEEEKEYIKNKLFRNSYVFIYGVKLCGVETGCFGVNSIIANYDYDYGIGNFSLPYYFGMESKEFFLSNIFFNKNEYEHVICEAREKDEYDYSYSEDIKEILNYKIIKKYGLTLNRINIIINITKKLFL